MQCSSRARRNRLAALGMLLCVLAAVFAVEAKLGWYSPDTAARVELSASKLPGDEAPKLLDSSASIPTPVLDLLPEIAVFAAFVVMAVPVLRLKPIAVPQLAGVLSHRFPPQFLRPPPQI